MVHTIPVTSTVLQDSGLLRSRLGSPIQLQMSRRGLGSSAPMCKNHSTSDTGTQSSKKSYVLHSYGAAPQRLPLPRSDIEILTTFNDDTSSIRDDYTAWATADPTTVRARHMTDRGQAKPVSREARIRKCLSSPSEYKFAASKPIWLLAQTRISILSWNPCPRRGTPGAIERHIVGK